MSRTFVGCVFTALLFAPCRARAEPHEVCLSLDLGPNYWDASPRQADGQEFKEEFGRNEGPQGFPAQRWLVRILDEDGGDTLYGWAPLDGGGCAQMDLPGDLSARIEWLRWAAWDQELETGNVLVGYECDANLADCNVLDPSWRVVPVDTTVDRTDVVVETPQAEIMDYMFWAATFAEERFAALGQQPLTGTPIYLAHDPLDILPGGTQADRTFGNQPSAIVSGNSWHSKYTIAHELGHQETLTAAQPNFGPTDIDYCHDPNVYPAIPLGCKPNHTMESHEWHSAAAVEGAAHWFSAATWNDVDLPTCETCTPGLNYVRTLAANDATSYVLPRQAPLCTFIGFDPCPAGVGNEWDWASAFALTYHGGATLRQTFTMLSEAFSSGTWTPHSPDAAFWEGFDQAMLALGTHYSAWAAAAQAMELDR